MEQTELEKKIDRIVEGIMSPYGEGAIYSRDESSVSHLDEDDKQDLRNNIKQLIQQEKEAVLREAEKAIEGIDVSFSLNSAQDGELYNVGMVLLQQLNTLLGLSKQEAVKKLKSLNLPTK